jgi:glyoxylase-like metal-dependent hydrolase (beta-lactamase superfamily II)
LGFTANDVRHILPTHLDVDHVGGAVDFPQATIHTSREEYQAATRPRTVNERVRFRDFALGELKWNVRNLSAEGENWFGFQGVRALPGSDDEILLIPLFGHTRGHYGVAVRDSAGWMLHAGDAYYSSHELVSDAWYIRAFMHMAHGYPALARANLLRLRDLHRDHPEVRVFCAHDTSEFVKI